MGNYAEPLMVTYLHNKGIKEGLPISGTFELTQRCNFNCEMCYVHNLKIKKDPISADEWIELGRQIKDEGTIFLLLTGGEPLIRDDFEKIYTALAEMGFMISINSNGSLIDKHIDLFKKYPPTRVNITLYGSNPEAYISLCKVNRFEKVVSNIKLLKDNGIEVRINMVMTPANSGCYRGIADISKELNTHLKPTAYSFPQIRLDMHQDDVRFTPYEAALNTIEFDRYRLDSDYFLKKMEKLSTLVPGPKSDRMRCRGGRASFWVTADGSMRPCGMVPEPNSYPFRDGFKKAWEQTKVQTAAIRLPKECMGCEYSGVCGVCAAMCKAETGEFNKRPEYICQMTKALYNIAKKEVEKCK